MKRHPIPAQPAPSNKGVYVVQAEDDYVPLPQRRLKYRGVDLSRSSVFRLIEQKEIKAVRLRVTGGAKGRTFILRDTLDAWLDRELARPENAAA